MIKALLAVIAAATIAIAVMVFVQMPAQPSELQKATLELEAATADLRKYGAPASAAKVWDKQKGEWTVVAD